jgi:peroxiredoxin
MAETPAVGAKAPDFTLVGDDGAKVSLKDFRGKKLVLYFYPKADTPGCTREAIAFNGLKAAFAKADTAILGVSADPVKAQDAFKRKHKGPTDGSPASGRRSKSTATPRRCSPPRRLCKPGANLCLKIARTRGQPHEW